MEIDDVVAAVAESGDKLDAILAELKNMELVLREIESNRRR